MFSQLMEGMEHFYQTAVLEADHYRVSCGNGLASTFVELVIFLVDISLVQIFFGCVACCDVM